MPGGAHELLQGRGSVAAHDSVPGERDGVDRPPHQVGGLQQLARRRLGARLGAPAERLLVGLGRHHVLGQLEMRGAGLLAFGDVEGLAHHLRDDRRVRQPGVPLGDRAHHPQQVHVLVRLLVHALQVSLPRERHERRAVEERVRHRGREVQRAGAERAKADTGAARQPPVHIRHVAAALLVADRDELDRRAGERLVQVERLLARDAEHVLHALGLEALHEDVACFPRSHWVSDCNVEHREGARGRLWNRLRGLGSATFVSWTR